MKCPAPKLRLLSLGLLCATTFFWPIGSAARLPFARSQIERRNLALGTWRLRIETGKFSRDVRCYLRDPKYSIKYSNGALGFRFGHHTNTVGAWVSIDRKPPVRWQAFLPELTLLNVPMDGSSLDNPTDSTVWVPARLLAGANVVSVAPNDSKRVKSFRLRGFVGLRDIARTMGCVPDARFLQ